MQDPRMQTEFISLMFSKRDGLECLKACMAYALMENELRVQQGFEPLDQTPLVMNLVTALGLKDQELEKIERACTDDMWSYSWHVFTNEWAWFRAKQEALSVVKHRQPDYNRQAEKFYKKNFEKYVKEIDMHSERNKRGDSLKP